MAKVIESYKDEAGQTVRVGDCVRRFEWVRDYTQPIFFAGEPEHVAGYKNKREELPGVHRVVSIYRDRDGNKVVFNDGATHLAAWTYKISAPKGVTK